MSGERRSRLSLTQFGGAVAAGEQAVVTDAMQALGQRMDEEAADELMGRQRHGLVAAGSFDPVVLALEGTLHSYPDPNDEGRFGR